MTMIKKYIFNFFQTNFTDNSIFLPFRVQCFL